MPPSFIAPILNLNGRSYATSGWGADRSYRGAGSYHNGLDFPATTGTPIRAAASGTVLTSADVSPDPAGKMITLDHGGGWRTRYLHLNTLRVAKGDRVVQGHHIADSGASGIQSSAAHLHFDVRAQPLAVLEFVRSFGKPKEFWPGEQASAGAGVPSEPLIPVDLYDPRVIANALRLGIPLYRNPIWTVLALGGLGYLAIRLMRQKA